MAGGQLKRRIENAVGAILIAIAIPLFSVFITLITTPPQKVTTGGQTIEVNAGARGLATSGPAQLDLFGTSIPTTLGFGGPFRPQLKWSHVSHYDQLISSLQEPQPLGERLVAAWKSYFTNQVIFAVLLAGSLAAVIALVMRVRWRTIAAAAALSILVAGAVEAIGVTTLLASATNLPERVHSLDDIVGRRQLTLRAGPEPQSGAAVDAVVIGDSTAAGAGNPGLKNATAEDKACRRSGDSYAADIAVANSWQVVNLACTNATITDGLFGDELINGVTVPAQLSRLSALHAPKVVIVSIGANEMHWANLMQLCLASSTSCDDAASAAWYQQALDDFALNYYDLLTRLAVLPSHPRVLINQYYAPLSPSVACPREYNVTAEKSKQMLARLQTFNDALAQGARGFGFEPVEQDFSGHELCTTYSYVQGPIDSAPMHPNVAGEFAIALAIQRELTSPTPLPSPGSTASASPSPSPSSSP